MYIYIYICVGVYIICISYIMYVYIYIYIYIIRYMAVKQQTNTYSTMEQARARIYEEER